MKNKKALALALDESSDSAIHTVCERIKGIKGYKMTQMEKNQVNINNANIKPFE